MTEGSIAFVGVVVAALAGVVVVLAWLRPKKPRPGGLDAATEGIAVVLAS
jgi:hypothetical protein